MKQTLTHWIICTCAVFIQAAAWGKAVTETRTVEGCGTTAKAAVIDALVEASAQVNGLTLTSQKKQTILTETKDTDIDSTLKTIGKFEDLTTRETFGLIHSYKILKQWQADGLFWARLEVTCFGEYLAGNQIVVALFRHRCPEYPVHGVLFPGASVSSSFSQQLSNRLVGSPFTVLDRNFSPEVADEYNRLFSPDTDPRERIKMYRQLVADYVVGGEITALSAAFTRNIFTDRLIFDCEAAVNYRVILGVTGEVKAAGTVTVEQGDVTGLRPGNSPEKIMEAVLAVAAQKAAVEILAKMFPSDQTEKPAPFPAASPKAP